jgi:hypothetical protein
MKPGTATAREARRAAPLDLHAPDIRRVFSQAELQRRLPEPGEEQQETVQVQGEREMAPISVGIMALPWAIRHPTQAWRIFMPMPASQVK